MPRNPNISFDSLYFGAILDLELKLLRLKEKFEKEIKIQNQNGITLDDGGEKNIQMEHYPGKKVCNKLLLFLFDC